MYEIVWDCCFIYEDTLRKVSVFGVFLARIFPHSDWIRRDTLRIQSARGKMRTRKTPIRTSMSTSHSDKYDLASQYQKVVSVNALRDTTRRMTCSQVKFLITTTWQGVEKAICEYKTSVLENFCIDIFS